MAESQNDPDGAQPDLLTFLASSVHDMKNSVSMLIGGLQHVLATHDRETLPAFDELAQMSYEARRINNNLVQLLTLYKLGKQLYPFDPGEVVVADFLAQAAEQSGYILKSRGVALEVVAPPDLIWYFDEDLIASVVGNAFGNAVRYTRDRVRLAADVRDGYLEIAIEDNGRGYPENMIDQAIDPIHRVDFASGGTGLGLYFSAAMAELHRNHARRGQIAISNGGELRGGRFVIRLP